MISVDDMLPETKINGLVSEAVLFMVDGIIYSGHYHDNGWFYCDENTKNKVRMASGPKATSGMLSFSELPKQKCTAWEYLRPNA